MIDYPEGLPCWAPGAADYLASILTRTECAVEWGGGASSAWLAPKVAHLHVVEHDLDWVERIAAATDEFNNVTIHHHPFADPLYLNPLVNLERAPVPHVWLIDGYRRIDCLRFVESKAKPGDLIVCDDALDYAEHILSFRLVDVHRFDMPHPHAREKLTSPKHKVWRNSVRTYAPMTKETWIWRA